MCRARRHTSSSTWGGDELNSAVSRRCTGEDCVTSAGIELRYCERRALLLSNLSAALLFVEFDRANFRNTSSLFCAAGACASRKSSRPLMVLSFSPYSSSSSSSSSKLLKLCLRFIAEAVLWISLYP